MINKHSKVSGVQISTVFGPIYHAACRKVHYKRDFLNIKLTTFFGVGNFANTSAMRVILFFWKCSKCYLHFKNAEKSFEQNFCLWDYFTWIGCVTLSLLRREHLSSTVNALTNSLKTLHITKRDFFGLNCFRSDQ